MGTNYPDVVPGQEVTFSAQQENDIRHLLNAMNGIGGGVLHGGNSKVSRLKVYNGIAEKFKKGVAVSLKNTIVDDAVEAVKYTDDLPHWGITTDIIDPGCFGEIVVSGPVEIAYIGDGHGDADGNFVKPVEGGEKFRRFKDSGVPLLADAKNSRYIVLLGGQPSKATTEYNGYFTCKVLAQTEDDINKNQLRVAVCDGVTWKETQQISGVSKCVINDWKIDIPSIIVTVTREKPYIVLKYTWERKTGEDYMPEILCISEDIFIHNVASKEGNYYYLIGELDTTQSALSSPAKIIQRHGQNPYLSTDGMIRFWTSFDVCSFIDYQIEQENKEDQEQENGEE